MLDKGLTLCYISNRSAMAAQEKSMEDVPIIKRN